MAERVGSRAMTFGAGGARSRRLERDEAADASRFFARIAYAVLGLGAPVGVVIHPLALFVIFPIGVALILMSAILEGPAGLTGRILRAFRVPAFVALIAGLGWATLSVLWTPYPVSAAQHALKLALLIAATLPPWPLRGKTPAPPTFICFRSAWSLEWRRWRPWAWRIFDRRRGRRRSRLRSGRPCRAAVSGAWRAHRARAQRLCAAAPDTGPGLCLYRWICAADGRAVCRIFSRCRSPSQT